jgi:hypothetical protein
MHGAKVKIIKKSVSLNFLESSVPTQACNGIALKFQQEVLIFPVSSDGFPRKFSPLSTLLHYSPCATR